MSTTTTTAAPELLLDGSQADQAIIQAAVAASTGGTIYLEDGSLWPSGFHVTPNPALQIRWVAEGSFDLGQYSQPGGWPMGPAQSWGSPPPGLGDGDQLWQYNNGSTVVTQAFAANPNNQPTMVFNYINDRTGGVAGRNGNSECVVINGYVRPGAVGNVYPLQININSSGMGGYGVDDVPISTSCVQTGTNNGWGAVFLMADCSGLGSGRGTAKWGTEVDLYASGPEQNGYWYNPYAGERTGGLLRLQRWTGGNSWAANHAYTAGAIIQNVMVNGVGYNAVCLASGTSGATPPAWVVGTGAKPGLNPDGSAIVIADAGTSWQLTVTMNASMARGYIVTTDSGVSVGRVYDTTATVDDCVVSAWAAKMNHPQGKGAAMRCAPNQPIDWNAGMVNWGPRQNTRTTMYNATTAAFEYAVNGKVAASLLDGLGARFAAGVAAFGAAPPAAQPVITGSKSTATAAVLAQLLAALAASGFIKDGTTA